MSAKPRKFVSIIDLLEAFQDERACSQHVAQQRWGDNPICPYCDHKKVYKFTNGTHYKCAECRRMFSVRVGTIFEDSNIPLRKWFVAIYLDTSHKKGISSHQLARDLHVAQKTAWFMLHRIRTAMKDNDPAMLGGIVEGDCTFIGGKRGNMHQSKRATIPAGGTSHMKPVFGLLQRGGKVIARVVDNENDACLFPIIIGTVIPKSFLVTDGGLAFKRLRRSPFHHRVINHKAGEYVRGAFDTNSIESFWSTIKRGYLGIYHYWSQKHLHRYVAEFVFRFNTREISTQSRFDFLLSNIGGTLPYKTLIAQ